MNATIFWRVNFAINMTREQKTQRLKDSFSVELGGENYCKPAWIVSITLMSAYQNI